VNLTPGTKCILVLESDPDMRERISRLLLQAGYRVIAPDSQTRGRERLASRGQDAAIVSLDWGSRDLERQLRTLRRQAGVTPVVLLCPASAVEKAVEALGQGIDDYLLRPPHRTELEARLERILERNDLDSRIAYFQDELSKRSGFRSIEARSAAMRDALDRVLRVAPMRSTVLILGESGVGKELVARAVHFNSPRRDGPFMALNCAAMPSSLIESELFGHEKGAFTGAHARVRGKFEIAHKGTLFLDEIAEMEPATQAKLLRVLEEREFMRIGGDQSIRVDVRVIAATNADLGARVSRARFRQDLLYRLKVVTIDVPPLRRRRDDVPPLVETFLDDLSRTNAVPRKAITPEAITALQSYRWPGNVRELKNLVESLLVSVTGELIRLEDLPQSMRVNQPSTDPAEIVPGTSLAEMERELIRRTLEHTGGNRTHSASLLGIGVRTLQRKIQTYALDIPPRRRRSRRSPVLPLR